MKTLLSILWSLVITFSSAGKDNSYLGWINVDGKKINFSVTFSIAQNNLVSGTSITAAGTSDETKCKIKGKYNPRTKGIYFYETVVLSSKARYENLNFCLLSATLKRKETNTEIKYSGAFTGYIRGTKKKCAAGTMLVSTKKTKKASPKITIAVTHQKQKTDTLVSASIAKRSITYNYSSKSVSFYLWDNIQADGDRVSVYLDGKKILDNYELQKEKKKLTLSLADKPNHYIKIVAESEGKAAPNTARILLKLGNQTKELATHAKTGEAVYIALKEE